MTSKSECPVNGCDLRGSEIPQHYLDAGYYGPWSPGRPKRYYGREIGVEIPGVYDGVLYWLCPDCGAAWHRWTGVEWCRKAAQPYIDRANAAAATHEWIETVRNMM